MTDGTKEAQSTEEVQELEFRLARAMSHRLRIAMLEHLTIRPASSAELAPLLGAPLSNVSYHMRVLVELGCVEAVSKTSVRGATKTTYRSVVEMLLDDAVWAKLSPATKAIVSEAGVDSIVSKAEVAIHGKTFDSRPDRHMSGVTLELDERAWKEATEMLRLTFQRFYTLADESRARVGDRDARVPVTHAQLLFESPPGTASAPGQ